MPDLPDYYAVLGVDKTATQDHIKQKYRELVRYHHPDRLEGLKRLHEQDGDEVMAQLTDREIEEANQRLQRINAAYRVLSHPVKRRRYDAARIDDGPMARTAWASRPPTQPDFIRTAPPAATVPKAVRRARPGILRQYRKNLRRWAHQPGYMLLVLLLFAPCIWLSIGPLLQLLPQSDSSDLPASVSQAIQTATDQGAPVDLAFQNLEGKDLSGIDLTGANLEHAHLRDATLCGTHLELANLRGADLRGVDLTAAYLRDADLTGVQISTATVLPDGSHCTDAGDLRRFTDPNHPDFWQPQ